MSIFLELSGAGAGGSRQVRQRRAHGNRTYRGRSVDEGSFPGSSGIWAAEAIVVRRGTGGVLGRCGMVAEGVELQNKFSPRSAEQALVTQLA